MPGTQRLPSNLNDLGNDELHAALQERKDRLSQLLARDDDQLSGADVDELKRLNDETEKLEKHLDPPMLNTLDQGRIPMIHPGGGRGAARHTKNPAAYGRVDGLGAAFIKQVGAKALDGTSGGATLPGAFFDPRLNELPQRALFVRSLIPTMNVNSDKVAYIRQSVFTNAAAAVAAGALKPTSVLTVERLEAPIAVVAHVSEALDRSLLADYDQLTGFVDDQLRLGVLLEEEDQLLNGNGTPPNISGILDQSGLQTQALGADAQPDAIHKAMTKIRVVFAEPDAVVMHPNDWQEIALLRTADGIYIWGEPADEAEPRIWGKRVIVSPVMAEGTALVGAFGAGAIVYEREGARVSFAETGLGDNAGEELFTRNQIRFRAESRLGLAVTRPNYFCTVTGI